MSVLSALDIPMCVSAFLKLANEPLPLFFSFAAYLRFLAGAGQLIIIDSPRQNGAHQLILKMLCFFSNYHS